MYLKEKMEKIEKSENALEKKNSEKLKKEMKRKLIRNQRNENELKKMKMGRSCKIEKEKMKK